MDAATIYLLAGDVDMQKSSSTRYSRVSVDEMDIKGMPERYSHQQNV